MYDLLTYCESFRQWPASVGYAARLAAAFDSQLTGMYVCAAPASMLSPYDTPQLMTEVLLATRQIEEDAYASGPFFEAFARERGATRASWLVGEGDTPSSLGLASSCHDALVIGRTPYSPWGSLSAVGSIVLGTDIPCIIIPENQPDEVSLDCVAIAWNGSVEAMRATHAALPILRRARKVSVLHGEQRPPANMASWKPQFSLSNYLSSHGIQSESVFLPEPSATTGAMLLDSAREAGANMLVMGAYGHTRFSEWVLGGATRAVLEHISLPVFMRH